MYSKSYPNRWSADQGHATCFAMHGIKTHISMFQQFVSQKGGRSEESRMKVDSIRNNLLRAQKMNSNDCHFVYHRINWYDMKDIHNLFQFEFNQTEPRVCIDPIFKRRKPWLEENIDWKNRVWKIMYQQCPDEFY